MRKIFFIPLYVKKQAASAIGILKGLHHHLIFLISIISLALLAAWWAVFINQSIEHNRSYTRENLRLSLETISLRLGMDRDRRPATGVYGPDNRFEVAPCREDGQDFVGALLPAWPDLCIKTREPVLAAIERDFKRKKLMVAGESGVLVLIILLSSIFLYRFIKLERRTAREVEAFWGRVTHEIKTPITGIKAFLQSLKNESIDPAQLPIFVDMALKQVERQEQLAGNILAGYGLRSGKSSYVPHLENFNLDRGIREYFNAHSLRLTDAELRLPTPGPGKNIAVQVDLRFFRVILDNVVDNAQKYCSPGLILEVSIFERDRKAVLAIKDNGPGFQPGMAEKIFRAFKYPKEQLPGTAHGSGMGLYISRQLAEQMGGRLTASSEGKGRGTEFRLSLILSRK
jgi:signal transduction histidine kinase